ncbi:hypothetical protein G9A89_002509 [Geosiphon pyriformis]|nr:hypothetical protein G9A89_002509 [Geosiphon pyriformis]
MPQLVSDVLPTIFKDLKHKDLSSCALVNREWCVIAVPLIWANPFVGTIQKRWRLMKTLSSMIEIHATNSLLISKRSTTSFDYLSFITTVDLGDMIDTFRIFYNSLLINNPGNRLKSLAESFFDILISRNVMLRSFTIRKTVHQFGSRNLGFWVDSRYAGLISSITYLKINAEFPKNDILLSLSELCNKVKDFEIWIFDINQTRIEETTKNLATFIKSQKGLEHLSVVNMNGFASHVIEALPSQAETLLSLEFISTDFKGCPELSDLACCHKLESLLFHSCWNINEKMIAPLLKADFKDLQRVEIPKWILENCSSICQWADHINHRLRGL